jgi:hypothetical protein
MSKKQERIITIGLAGFLIAYFCYQVAYGYNATNGTTTIGPNGTMNVPNMPNGLWATIHAPPGSTVGPIKIIQGNNGYSVGANFTTR